MLSNLSGLADLQLMALACVKDKAGEYEKQISDVIALIANWMIDIQDEDGSFDGNPLATGIAIQVSSNE